MIILECIYKTPNPPPPNSSHSTTQDFNWDADKLPYDHHSLYGVVAPRAVWSTDNLDYNWCVQYSHLSL